MCRKICIVQTERLDIEDLFSYSFPVNPAEKQMPVEIPYESISEDALTGVIESFLQREGTDYGAVEISAETKFRQLHTQILNGHAKIIFDPDTESVTLMSKDQWIKKNRGSEPR